MTTIALPRPRNALLDRLRTIQFGLSARGAVGVGLATQRGGAASVPDWWAVAGKTCVAAYQPKGAVSYAASKVNLANPGTDITDGTAYPTWDATSGWKLDGASEQWLDTGIIPNSAFSVLFQYSDKVAYGNDLSPFVSTWDTATWNRFVIGFYYGNVPFFASGEQVVGWGYACRSSGFLAIAGRTGYDNNLATLSIGDFNTPATSSILIGQTAPGISSTPYLTANIQAIAIYSDTLTAGEVADKKVAMAAL